MKDFYYCQDWGTFLEVPNILLSFGVAYHKGKIRSFDRELKNAEKIFLDCGAYTLRNTFENYPISEYIEWINASKFDITYAATVDIIGDYENTVRVGFECMQLDSSISWVPVLQGQTVKDYSDCAQLYKDGGVNLSGLVAVGGLKQKDHLFIRRVLCSLNHFKIHAFGLTLSNLRDPTIWNSVFSTDTGTWKSRPFTTVEKYKQLATFKIKLEILKRDYNLQTTLV